MTDTSGQQEVLPTLTPVKNRSISLSGYAATCYQSELDKVLRRFDGFQVTNPRKRDHLKEVCSKIPEKDGYSIFHAFAINTRCDNLAVDALQRLLSLGVNFDFPHLGHYNWTPLHHCSHQGNWPIADVLVKCRPNFQALNSTGHTPAALVRALPPCDNRQRVAAIWDNAAKNGFPTVAELAAKREYWAMHHLLRRGIVTNAEKAGKYNEKTALEWVVYHERFELTAKLQFHLQTPSFVCVVPSPSVSGTPVQQQEVVEYKLVELIVKQVLAVTAPKFTKEDQLLTEQLESPKNRLETHEKNFSKLEEQMKELKNDKKVLRDEMEALKAQADQSQKDAKQHLEDEKKMLANQMEALIAQADQIQKNAMGEIEMLKTEWKKKEDAWEEQMKAMQAQLVVMPSIISASVSASVAVFQPPASKKPCLSDS